MDKKIIKQVKIDQSNMSSSAASRTLLVQGEVSSEFIVNVIKINSTSKESYYNFKTKSFTTAFTSKNSFRLKMAGSSFQLAILFPADATGDGVGGCAAAANVANPLDVTDMFDDGYCEEFCGDCNLLWPPVP